MSGILLSGIVLFIVPLLLGTLWNGVWKLAGISKIQKNSVPGNYLSGVFVMLCLYEGAVIISMKLDLPFSKLILMVSILFLVLCGITCVFCQKELKALLFNEKIKQLQIEKSQAWKGISILLFLLIFILQVLLIFHFAPATGDDNTMETVQTTLVTDTIGMYNPLTGLPYETGPTFQGKLLSLPVFYAYMIQIFSVDPAVFVYGIIPIWVLCMTYLAYSLVGDALFEDRQEKEEKEEKEQQQGKKQEEQKENKKQLFLFFYAVLLLFGGYLFTTPGYQLLHGSWKGETIVVTVLIPYLIGLGMNWKKERLMTVLQAVLTAITVIPLMHWRKGIVYIGLLFVILLITGLCMQICEKGGNPWKKR